MNLHINFKLTLTLFFFIIITPISPNAFAEITLKHLKSTALNSVNANLNEPSGLAISNNTGSLWLISDDTSAVFEYLDNQTIKQFAIKEDELEAITLDEQSGSFYTVNEKKAKISRFDLTTRQKLLSRKLKKMKGYQTIKRTIQKAGSKNGLEGLTWHPERHTLFALLEGPPGLLIEISADLKTILNAKQLSRALGFKHDSKKNQSKIDFSGMTYDNKRDKLWILSDESSSIFIYDINSNQVTQRIVLKRKNKKGNFKKIAQPEGITLNNIGTMLYVVCNKKAKLYQWHIKEE